MTKKKLSDLALLGAPPAFEQILHVGRPNVGDTEAILGRFREILERRWLTNDGPCVQELEREIARYVGVKHCIAVSNGTIGLELAIRALGLRGEVIVPAFTFVATAHAVRWLGHTPVFADVDAATHSLDVRDVESLISPATTAIIGVHLWGIPCDVDGLQELARRRGLKLLFDSAHAFGCSKAGTMVGGFGDAEVFSFHATKFFNTFEGGAITTNDSALAAECRNMRNFGFAGYDNVTSLGTNAKMTEVCAAMGLESLRAIDGFVETNRENHQRYTRRLSEVTGLQVLGYPATERCNFQYVVVSVRPEAGLSRDELVKVLHSENVLARRYFAPGVHRMPAYRAEREPRPLPVTDQLVETVLCLPTGTAVTASEIDGIAAVLQLAVEHAPRVREALRSAAG
jgi:dTDP-4-amino-4,6-dideoxygalactose transaminase